MRIIDRIEDVPSDMKHYFKPSMFPPTPEEAKQMHLDRTFRILPHLQDTGGFFVAVLRKIQQNCNGMDKEVDLRPKNTEKLPRFVGYTVQLSFYEFRKPAPAKKARFFNNEDPFVFLSNSDKNYAQFIADLERHFGIDRDQFPHSNLLVRSENTERKKEIYFVNNAIKEFLECNGRRFRIVLSI